VLIDAIYIFFNAFCPCILNIYSRLVRLVRCNVSTDPVRTLWHQDTSAPGQFGTKQLVIFLVPNCLTVISDWCQTVLVSKCLDRCQ